MKEEIQKWWRIALDDLETSKYNLEGDRLAAAAFYAQQSVEKALKTLMLHNNKPFEKTHDITKLSVSVSAPERIRKLCAAIHPIYYESRYPDRAEFNEFNDKDYIAELVTNAKEIIKWTKKKLQIE